VGAQVSADVTVYDTCHASYRSRRHREQARVFKAALDLKGVEETPLGALTRYIPSHPSFAASPSVILRSRDSRSESSIACFGGIDDCLSVADAMYAAFRINAHLSSLRGESLRE
jgi:hypothetical protein